MQVRVYKMAFMADTGHIKGLNLASLTVHWIYAEQEEKVGVGGRAGTQTLTIRCWLMKQVQCTAKQAWGIPHIP